MTHSLHSVYSATWLWLPFLMLFLVQGLYCSSPVKLILFKIALYYIVAAIGLQLLLPTAHLTLRVLLFDLTTRVFLLIQAAEILWNSWDARPAPASGGRVPGQKKLLEEDEEDEAKPAMPRRGLISRDKRLILAVVSVLLYLSWVVLGVMFAFTLTPGM